MISEASVGMEGTAFDAYLRVGVLGTDVGVTAENGDGVDLNFHMDTDDAINLASQLQRTATRVDVFHERTRVPRVAGAREMARDLEDWVASEDGDQPVRQRRRGLKP